MEQWPADKVERRSVESLVPYARNARTHSQEQVAQIAASIREWGWTVPILIGEDGGIIAGHGRVLAALQLGLADVPCMVAAGWTEAQRRAYVIADNKLALNAEWDDVLLRIELDDLSIAGFDLDLLGFDVGELSLIMDDEDPGGAGSGGGGAGSLAAKFGLPPFTILNAREGWWQDRKQAWLGIGIRSELGRGEGDNASPGGSPRPGLGSRAGYFDKGEKSVPGGRAFPGKGARANEPKLSALTALPGHLRLGAGGLSAQVGKGKGKAQAYHDGAVLGQGGLADQVAAAATARRKITGKAKGKATDG